MASDEMENHMLAVSDELDELAQQLQALLDELGTDEAQGSVRPNLTRDLGLRTERLLRIAYWTAGLGAGRSVSRGEGEISTR